MINHQISINDFADYKQEIVLAGTSEGKWLKAEIDYNKSVILFRVTTKNDFVSCGYEELEDAIALYNML